jgi:hypothetical protein
MPPIPDARIEISQADLLHVLLCALSYDARLPYGLIPEGIYGALNAEGKQWIDSQPPPGEPRKLRPRPECSQPFADSGISRETPPPVLAERQSR